MLDSRASAGAEIVAVRAAATPHLKPEGDCQIAWTTTEGTSALLDVVSWKRLDHGPMEWGQEFVVTIQGRAGRDLRLPLHTASARFVLTLSPEDVAELIVGDVTRASGWMLGVRLIGARPAQRLLPVAAHLD
jgi:hypothetical protein